jgi:hypothetical protein
LLLEYSSTPGASKTFQPSRRGLISILPLRLIFQFDKRRQLFIRTHNVTLSVIAVRVNNPDRLTVGINGCDTAPTPTGFAEIVSDDFPVLHTACFHLKLIADAGRINSRPA